LSGRGAEEAEGIAFLERLNILNVVFRHDVESTSQELMDSKA